MKKIQKQSPKTVAYQFEVSHSSVRRSLKIERMNEVLPIPYHPGRKNDYAVQVFFCFAKRFWKKVEECLNFVNLLFWAKSVVRNQRRINSHLNCLWASKNLNCLIKKSLVHIVHWYELYLVMEDSVYFLLWLGGISWKLHQYYNFFFA